MARQVDVVGAVIIREGTVLCVQRGNAGTLPGKWEFPGGKVEPGEEAVAALAREIREELDCAVDVGDLLTTTVYDYPFGTVKLMTYVCALTEGDPSLTEHAAMMWALPGQLTELDWAAADIPAVELVRTALLDDC